MEKNLVFFVIILLFSMALQAQQTQTGAYTLNDCYREAVKNNETIGLKNETVNEAKGRYSQALGNVLPRLDYGYVYLKQGTQNNPAVPSYLYASESAEQKLTVSETLSLRLKEIDALSVSKTEQRERVSDVLRAKQLLFDNISELFLLSAEQEATIGILEEINSILNKRLGYLNERVSVGKSRQSETVSTNVVLYQNSAQIETIKSQEMDTLRQLEFITGIEKIERISDSTDTISIPGDEEAFAANIDSRPDVFSAKQAMLLADKLVFITKANFWPSINLMGNYYFQNTGRFAVTDWDLSLNVSMPILPVIQIQGQVKQSKAQAAQAELQFKQTRRNAIMEVRSAYEDLKASVRIQSFYEKSLAQAKENYRLEENDYRLSLINNLELIQSLQSLQDNKINYMHSYYRAKRAYWHFKAATGETL